MVSTGMRGRFPTHLDAEMSARHAVVQYDDRRIVLNGEDLQAAVIRNGAGVGRDLVIADREGRRRLIVQVVEDAAHVVVDRVAVDQVGRTGLGEIVGLNARSHAGDHVVGDLGVEVVGDQNAAAARRDLRNVVDLVVAEVVADRGRSGRRVAVDAVSREVLNDVVLNQVLVSFGSDERTREVLKKVQGEGTCWMSGTRWHGKEAMRISVSSWATTSDDVDKSVEAIIKAAN